MINLKPWQVALWDLRNLKLKLHSFESHKDEIFQVSQCLFKEKVRLCNSFPGAMVSPQRDDPGQLGHGPQVARVGPRQDRGGAERRGCRGRTSRAPLHPRRPHLQDLRLLMEPNWRLGYLLRLGGQYHAGEFFELSLSSIINSIKLPLPIIPPQVWQMAENIYNDEDPDTPAAELDDKPWTHLC